jgi:nitrogen fixation protein FixH
MEAASVQTKSFNPWPVAIIAFFAVAILGCVSYVIFCNLHPVDLVSADYYEQEVRYQAQLDSLRRAQQPGAKPAVAYDAARQFIIITFPAALDAARFSGSVQLYRPSAASQDRRLPLQPGDSGVQEIDARPLEPGLWKVRITWQTGGENNSVDEKVVVSGRKT